VNVEQASKKTMRKPTGHGDREGRRRSSARAPRPGNMDGSDEGDCGSAGVMTTACLEEEKRVTAGDPMR
jgi:hypothetical protein